MKTRSFQSVRAEIISRNSQKSILGGLAQPPSWGCNIDCLCYGSSSACAAACTGGICTQLPRNYICPGGYFC